jgi:hypothetical protein
MSPQDESETRQALKAARLQEAPGGFKAALLDLFGADKAASFALVDGDDGIVLGVGQAGLITIDSHEDDDWITGRVRVVPMDKVGIHVDTKPPLERPSRKRAMTRTQR